MTSFKMHKYVLGWTSLLIVFIATFLLAMMCNGQMWCRTVNFKTSKNP
jgi:hypothetical protein